MCRQLATVVAVDGVIDDTNVDRVTALALRFVLAEKPYVLDLDEVSSVSSHAVSLLSAVDGRCFHSGVEWAMTASAPVRRLVRASGVDFPIASSVPDALKQFAENIEERRRLLPLLTKKTA
ncbi:STAS domain-containing protein [Mycolicibacterium sp. XJ1819]